MVAASVAARVAALPPGVSALRTLPRHLADDVAAAVALARRFDDEVVRPCYRAIDRRVDAEPEWVPREIVQAAGAWGLYTAWLPRLVGGRGWSMLSLYAFLEEVSTVCVGIANVVGVHYLGVTTLCATWNARLIRRVLGEVVAGERRGEPCLVSLAITEPAAGTDMEETELLARIRPGTVARRVDGGYRIDGRKAFISNGHVSTWHVVICCEDRARAADTGVVIAVENGTPGFTLGAIEHKMGQRACVASELVFDDCFVDDAHVAIDRRQISGPARDVFQQVIDYVVSSTRAGVGAFGAGVARGAYQAACELARRRRPDGTRPVDDQCVRMRLADLFTSAELARLAWQEAAWANCEHGLFRDLHRRAPYALGRLAPARLIAALAPPVLDHPWTTRLLRRRHFRSYARASAHLTSGWGSLAKVVGSDLAVASADLALELCGAEGTRHDAGVEKRVRDAKLLQIYEGTNQLNRLNLFKCLVGPGWDVEAFA